MQWVSDILISKVIQFKWGGNIGKHCALSCKVGGMIFQLTSGAKQRHRYNCQQPQKLTAMKLRKIIIFINQIKPDIMDQNGGKREPFYFKNL